MTDQQLPFLRVLAGSKPSENYLSRAFQACFTHSPAFTNAVLDTLWHTCRLDGKTPDSTGWVCDYQPRTPNGGKIRPDLCLRPFLTPDQSAEHKPIYIESKLGAKLHEAQLRNYVESGTEILVAITKHWPEVSRDRLQQIGVKHLRWQDISRALANISNLRGKDRFLCDSFSEYLEYSNMSYREDLTISHLQEIASTLSKIGQPKYPHFVPGSSFALAHSCLELLRDARRIAQEKLPTLTGCGNWGPGYYHIQNEDDPTQIDWHVFGFEMYKKGQYDVSRVLCSVEFSASENSEIYWLVAHRGSTVKKERENEVAISEVTTKNNLDAYLLADSIVEAVKKWNPF